MSKLLWLLFLPCTLAAQHLPDSTVQRIDNVFRTFKSNSPGCAIAISKDGQVVFSKGYGMANLEYAAPIVPSTIFHIASESKQYVAFCMLLLEKEGKLSIDDDIRKYLDWVPDFGKKITIRQLIHHTSGLRDQWQLLANAGWQLDDVITQDHVIKLVSKQKALNFEPGTEHMYCNTGYTLMAEIVKKVSGQKLRHYADKNIFKPLGMTETFFYDNYQELVPYRAYSYYNAGPNKWAHAVLSYSIVGATSLFTNVLDELKWLRNYETGEVGGKELIEKMYQVGVLNNGKKLSYAFAIGFGNLNGWQQIGHGGADAGYRTIAFRYPEKNLGIVVFTNAATANPTGLARQVAEILIPEKKKDSTPALTNPLDASRVDKLPGTYYSERGELLILEKRNGKLYRINPDNRFAQEFALFDAGDNWYKAANDERSLMISPKQFSADSVREMEIALPTTGSMLYKRKPNGVNVIPSEYVGRYYNDETEAFYSVSIKDSTLMLDHRKFASVPLKNIAPDQFTNPNWWMYHIRFLRDKKNKITGFEVNAGRVQHILYRKQ